jgi:hypothetical protein
MKIKLEASALVNTYEEALQETKRIISKFLDCLPQEVESKAEIEIHVTDDQMVSDGIRVDGLPYMAKIYARIK